MSHGDDPMRLVRRNKLVGMWAARELGLEGDSAKAYSDGLAMGALDFGRSDVLDRIRTDFATAGVVRSDEQILEAMSRCWLDAAGGRAATRTDASDAAVVQIARTLLSK